MHNKGPNKGPTSGTEFRRERIRGHRSAVHCIHNILSPERMNADHRRAGPHLAQRHSDAAPHLSTPYLVEDAIRGMDEAGVDGAILHSPASWDSDSNEQAVEAVLTYPKRFAIPGYPALDKRIAAG
jgi:hypothetical protein